MKKNQNEDIDIVAETEATEVVEEVKESKFKNFVSKGWDFTKKNGLKIALGAGAVIGTGLLVVKALRKGDEEAALEYLAEDDYETDYLEELEKDSNVVTEE